MDPRVEVHYIGPEEIAAAPKISPVQREVHSAIWLNCILPGDNEWTTWSDAIVLTEVAIAAIPDGWGKINGQWVRVVAVPAEGVDA